MMYGLVSRSHYTQHAASNKRTHTCIMLLTCVSEAPYSCAGQGGKRHFQYIVCIVYIVYSVYTLLAAWHGMAPHAVLAIGWHMTHGGNTVSDRTTPWQFRQVLYKGKWASVQRTGARTSKGRSKREMHGLHTSAGYAPVFSSGVHHTQACLGQTTRTTPKDRAQRATFTWIERPKSAILYTYDSMSQAVAARYAAPLCCSAHSSSRSGTIDQEPVALSAGAQLPAGPSEPVAVGGCKPAAAATLSLPAGLTQPALRPRACTAGPCCGTPSGGHVGSCGTAAFSSTLLSFRSPCTVTALLLPS